MSLDTRVRILRHQILDLGAINTGGVTLSGVEAREIIEDFLYDALNAGNNIVISYDDVPEPGIVTIGTTASLSVDDITASGTATFGATVIDVATLSGIDVIDFTEGEGGIICDQLTISGSVIKFYDDNLIPTFLFYTSSGTIGVKDDVDLLGLSPGKLEILGDIYCDDLHTSGNTIFLGSTIQLADSGGDLSVNADVDITGVVTATSDIIAGTNIFSSSINNIILRPSNLPANLSGQHNIILGINAGDDFTSAGYNIVIGQDACGQNTGSSYNTVLGVSALEGAQTNTTVSYNIAIGYNAAERIYNGSQYNIYIGEYAGRGENSYSPSQNRSTRCIAIGYSALRESYQSDDTVAIGYRAGYNYDNHFRSVIIGSEASYNATDYDNVKIGYRAGYAGQQNFNVSIGSQAGYNSGDADYIVCVGANAGYGNTGDDNVIIGYQAGYNGDGNDNVFIGYNSGYSNSGSRNAMVGFQAGYQSSGAQYCVLMGEGAGYQATGSSNTFLGYRSGWYATGSQNVYIGHASGQGAGGSNNGTQNIAIGGYALLNVTSGQTNSIAIGYETLRNNTGSSIIAIGYQAGYTGDGNNNIFIGYQAGYNETGSNKLYIENSNSATPLIYGEFDNDFLRINGVLDLTGDFTFGGTISGTGDIYCNDLFTAGSTVWIGDASITASGTDLIFSNVKYDNLYWDDVRVPGLQASIIDTRIPDIEQFDNAGGYFGVYTYCFDPDSIEEVHMSIQMPHGYKEGTDIYPHLHWAPTTASGGAVRWGIEYTWTNVGDVFPTPSVLIINDDADGVTHKQQIASFGSIDGTGKKLSSMLLIRLFRYATHVDDDYEYDAAFLEFDIHYQIDRPGSRQEYIK